MNWIMEMQKCKPGEYYCYTDKKCKKIPMGWHIARGGYIEKDEEKEEKKNGNGNGNGNGGGEVSEAAVSRAQQRFFGMVRATQKGEMENPSPEVSKAAASMSKSDVKDFAKTKHKKLPEKKMKESFAIDPKAHRQQQRAAKIRNLAKKGATEGERSAAERKAKGPKMFGETAYYRQDAGYQKKLKDQEKANKEKDARMKHGKNWKKFTSDAAAAKNRLRKGEVKKFNKETGKWESNKD